MLKHFEENKSSPSTYMKKTSTTGVTTVKQEAKMTQDATPGVKKDAGMSKPCSERTCYNCGNPGHISVKCPAKVVASKATVINSNDEGDTDMPPGAHAWSSNNEECLADQLD